jgi:hypothetical protein
MIKVNNNWIEISSTKQKGKYSNIFFIKYKSFFDN